MAAAICAGPRNVLMTVLNTLSNQGENWLAIVALCLVDPLSVKVCIGPKGCCCRATAALEIATAALKVGFGANRTRSILV